MQKVRGTEELRRNLFYGQTKLTPIFARSPCLGPEGPDRPSHHLEGRKSLTLPLRSPGCWGEPAAPAQLPTRPAGGVSPYLATAECSRPAVSASTVPGQVLLMFLQPLVVLLTSHGHPFAKTKGRHTKVPLCLQGEAVAVAGVVPSLAKNGKRHFPRQTHVANKHTSRSMTANVTTTSPVRMATIKKTDDWVPSAGEDMQTQGSSHRAAGNVKQCSRTGK